MSNFTCGPNKIYGIGRGGLQRSNASLMNRFLIGTMILLLTQENTIERRVHTQTNH